MGIKWRTVLFLYWAESSGKSSCPIADSCSFYSVFFSRSCFMLDFIIDLLKRNSFRTPGLHTLV